jgi:hypothetical protein
MKKAIATQTIIYLVLGLLVLMGLGYLLWRQIGPFPGEVNKAECINAQLTYCGMLFQCDYACTPFGQSWAEYAPGCSSTHGITASRTVCEDILRIPKG